MLTLWWLTDTETFVGSGTPPRLSVSAPRPVATAAAPLPRAAVSAPRPVVAAAAPVPRISVSAPRPR